MYIHARQTTFKMYCCIILKKKKAVHLGIPSGFKPKNIYSYFLYSCEDLMKFKNIKKLNMLRFKSLSTQS